MKHFLIILLFLIIPFLSPNFISAQNTTQATTNTEPSAWEQFVAWISGIFVKTDYQIISRSLDAKIQDMNDYGDFGDPNFKQKTASAGSRSQDSNSQNCRRGDVIRKVILGTTDYKLSQICSDSASGCLVKTLTDTGIDCVTIWVKDLAHYFVQLNQPFYCDDNDELIDIESNFIEKVNLITNLADVTIPESKKNCYKQIYDDFYLTPKGDSSDTEENAKKIIQTPLPANSQDPNKNNIDTRKQVDSSFTPASYLDETSDSYVKGAGGLKGLTPNSWKI